MKLLVLFYSTYGHIYALAKAAAEAAEKAGAEVYLKRVPETLPPEILEKIGGLQAAEAWKDIPLASPEELPQYDAILFGSPTRFGMMASQMKAFLDGTGGLWAKGALVDKLAGVFTSTATQHGGQEATILSFHTVLMHHGMILAGLPYSFPGQSSMNAIIGGSPYGAGTVTGPDGSKSPEAADLDGVRFQAERLVRLAQKLKA